MSRDTLIRELREIVGEQYVLIEKEDVIVYEQDGSILQAMPEIVVLPGNVEQVSAVVRAARKANVPIVPRGSGTGLAGGAVPAEGGIVLSLARLNRIVEIDLKNRVVIVEPGVINLDVTKKIAKDGFFYAPDPTSQAACLGRKSMWYTPAELRPWSATMHRRFPLHRSRRSRPNG
jgi:glycolate oxidase